MSLIVKESGGGRDFKPVPAGTHIGVCSAVIDCGLQPGFEGGPAQRKVYVNWEIPGERTEWTLDGKTVTGPMKIGRFYTLSLNEKATLRAHLENWRGKPFTSAELAGFDLFSIVGKACLVGVTHKSSGDRVYANVSSILSLPKGTPAPQVEGRITLYPDPQNPQAFDQVPEWLQKKILSAKSPDARQPATATGTTGTAPAAAAEDFNDDIPFAVAWALPAGLLAGLIYAANFAAQVVA